MDASKRLGFVGLGTMGAPMAQQVLKKHGTLVVYDVEDRAVRTLVEAGAKPAQSPRHVAEASDVVVTMLPHPDVFMEVVLGADGLAHGLQPGSFLIDMSTNGLEAIRKVADALGRQGVHVIDAPVGKGPWAAEKGELTILMGGDEKLCREIEWVVGLMGSTIYHCGPLGAGQVVKLANNLASCGNMAVLAEAYALAQAGGAKLDVLCEVMPHTSADSWQLRQTLNGKIRKGDFSPMFKLKLARKDMRLIVDMARELGTPIEVGQGVLDWYEKGEAAGHGELDWGAIVLVSNPELAPK